MHKSAPAWLPKAPLTQSHIKFLPALRNATATVRCWHGVTRCADLGAGGPGAPHAARAARQRPPAARTGTAARRSRPPRRARPPPSRRPARVGRLTPQAHGHARWLRCPQKCPSATGAAYGLVLWTVTAGCYIGLSQRVTTAACYTRSLDNASLPALRSHTGPSAAAPAGPRRRTE